MRARDDVLCGWKSQCVVVVSRFLIELVSNRQRVLKGPKCSWVLPAASRLSSQSSGCSPPPPRSRSGDWRVRQAMDAAGGCRGRQLLRRGIEGTRAVWPAVERVCGWRRGRGGRWFVSRRRLSMLDAQGSRLCRAQGSRELSSHAADARKAGLGRAEVGAAGCVGTGTWAWWEADPLP